MEVLKSSERLSKKLIFTETSPPPQKLRESEESEEALMINQAKLARWLKITTARRLSGRAAVDYSDRMTGTTVVPAGTRKRRIIHGPASMELQKHEEGRVVTLTDVTIHPNAEDTSLGTLDAHVNGFIYTASNCHMVFMHANVERYFLRLGDMVMPPLLQFHLKHPIMVGTKETKDIQFHLMPTPERQENKQTINCSRNKDLNNFVHKVEKPQWTVRFRLPIHFHALQEFEFCGACPTSASAIFALTYSSLVCLEETPFIVILLRDIEIVNLALHGPEGEEIDMTVVFKDFKLDVLEIRSIPLKFLTGIKLRLNFGGVKYYVNSTSESRNWSGILEYIRKAPMEFLESGGWVSLGLEDSITLAHYTVADSDLDHYTVADSDHDTDLRKTISAMQ